VPQGKQRFFITSINWLMLFKEIIPVYAAAHAIHVDCDNGISGALVTKSLH
jgi:hypothetical protein